MISSSGAQHNALRQSVNAVRQKTWAWFAVTDHGRRRSQSTTHEGGERLRPYWGYVNRRGR